MSVELDNSSPTIGTRDHAESTAPLAKKGATEQLSPESSDLVERADGQQKRSEPLPATTELNDHSGRFARFSPKTAAKKFAASWFGKKSKPPEEAPNNKPGQLATTPSTRREKRNEMLGLGSGSAAHLLNTASMFRKAMGETESVDQKQVRKANRRRRSEALKTLDKVGSEAARVMDSGAPTLHACADAATLYTGKGETATKFREQFDVMRDLQSMPSTSKEALSEVKGRQLDLLKNDPEMAKQLEAFHEERVSHLPESERDTATMEQSEDLYIEMVNSSYQCFVDGAGSSKVDAAATIKSLQGDIAAKEVLIKQKEAKIEAMEKRIATQQLPDWHPDHQEVDRLDKEIRQLEHEIREIRGEQIDAYHGAATTVLGSFQSLEEAVGNFEAFAGLPGDSLVTEITGTTGEILTYFNQLSDFSQEGATGVLQGVLGKSQREEFIARASEIKAKEAEYQQMVLDGASADDLASVRSERNELIRAQALLISSGMKDKGVKTAEFVKTILNSANQVGAASGLGLGLNAIAAVETVLSIRESIMSTKAAMEALEAIEEQQIELEIDIEELQEELKTATPDKKPALEFEIQEKKMDLEKLRWREDALNNQVADGIIGAFQGVQGLAGNAISTTGAVAALVGTSAASVATAATGAGVGLLAFSLVATASLAAYQNRMAVGVGGKRASNFANQEFVHAKLILARRRVAQRDLGLEEAVTELCRLTKDVGAQMHVTGIRDSDSSESLSARDPDDSLTSSSDSVTSEVDPADTISPKELEARKKKVQDFVGDQLAEVTNNLHDVEQSLKEIKGMGYSKEWLGRWWTEQGGLSNQLKELSAEQARLTELRDQIKELDTSDPEEYLRVMTPVVEQCLQFIGTASDEVATAHEKLDGSLAKKRASQERREELKKVAAELKQIQKDYVPYSRAIGVHKISKFKQFHEQFQALEESFREAGRHDEFVEKYGDWHSMMKELARPV